MRWREASAPCGRIADGAIAHLNGVHKGVLTALPLSEFLALSAGPGGPAGGVRLQAPGRRARRSLRGNSGDKVEGPFRLGSSATFRGGRGRGPWAEKDFRPICTLPLVNYVEGT